MIDFFFNIVNAALLIWLFKTIFKKNVIPSIRVQIRAQQETKEHLVSSITQLETAEVAIDKEIIDQEHLYSELEQKVMRWKQVYKTEKNEEAIQRKRIIEHIEHKRARQNMNFMYSKTQEIILPQAIQKARSELMELFKNSERSNAYITHIIEHLEKR